MVTNYFVSDKQSLNLICNTNVNLRDQKLEIFKKHFVGCKGRDTDRDVNIKDFFY